MAEAIANALRERDAREAIRAALEATGAFDAVYLGAFPLIDGRSAKDALAAAIEPVDGNINARYDGGGAGLDSMADARVQITFLARDEDGRRCDENVERLFMTALNVLTGSNLGGLAMPRFSRFGRYVWRRANPPERRIDAEFHFRYLIDQAASTAE